MRRAQGILWIVIVLTSCAGAEEYRFLEHNPVTVFEFHGPQIDFPVGRRLEEQSRLYVDIDNDVLASGMSLVCFGTIYGSLTMGD